MAKVSRTYRIEQETADRIAEISESEEKTATEVVEAAIHAYFSEKYAEKYIGNTANQLESADSPALAALVEQLAVKDAQLAKKDEQIAKLVEAVADGTKAVQGAQATRLPRRWRSSPPSRRRAAGKGSRRRGEVSAMMLPNRVVRKQLALA